MSTKVEEKPRTDPETRLCPMHRVLIHNDDITPMDFVVRVLCGVFALKFGRACEVMMEAHRTGVAHVVTEPLERAEFHVDQARSLSRARHFPLTFSIEPER